MRAVGLVILLMSSETRAADTTASEPQVKAALLYNFAKYVEWPTNVFAQASTPLVVGVLGDRVLSEALEKIVAGRTIDGRPVRVQPFGKDWLAGDCQLLFISAAEAKRQPEILEKIKTSPILTVGETDDFLAQGGVIRLLLKDHKLHFHINLGLARGKQLSIRSQLLNLAEQVVGKD